MPRYLGNRNKMEVHDLLNKQTNCQIEEILPHHRVPFNTLHDAHRNGYDDCHWCLGGSER